MLPLRAQMCHIETGDHRAAFEEIIVWCRHPARIRPRNVAASRVSLCPTSHHLAQEPDALARYRGLGHYSREVPLTETGPSHWPGPLFPPPDFRCRTLDSERLRRGRGSGGLRPTMTAEGRP
jgi:hypothetical protein